MKKIKFQIIFLILGLSCMNTIIAQKLEKEIDKVALENFKKDEPGAVIFIAKNNEIIYRKAFGQANLELSVALNPDMVLEIGSISKQFTAVAILQLVEKGQLKLSDPISKFLSNFPTQGQNITIHHLLTHTSGLSNYTSDSSWSEVWRNEYSINQVIDLFKDKPLTSIPGEKFSYSNSGYVLLGAIIEKISGLTYAEYLHKNIFEPLDMKNTYYGSRSKIIKNRANGYQRNGEFVNAEYLTFTQTYAAGAIMSSVNDLYLWNRAIKNKSILSEESLKLATTNYKTTDGKFINYGYGWFLNEIDGNSTIEHGGGVFGFISYALYVPSQDIYVTVLTNFDGYNPEALAVKLASIVLNKKKAESKSIVLNSEIASKWVGTYEFDDTLIRNIIFDNNTLYSQISGGNKIPLIPISENEFIFDGIAEARIKFEMVNNEVKALIINRIIVKTGKKVKIDKSEPKAIKLSTEILNRYVGSYKIPPSLTFKVFIENQSLFVEFPGQPKIEAYATSESNFFTKLGDAKIDFVKNTDNDFYTVIIKQNGQSFKANKI